MYIKQKFESSRLPERGVLLEGGGRLGMNLVWILKDMGRFSASRE